VFVDLVLLGFVTPLVKICGTYDVVSPQLQTSGLEQHNL